MVYKLQPQQDDIDQELAELLSSICAFEEDDRPSLSDVLPKLDDILKRLDAQ